MTATLNFEVRKYMRDLYPEHRWGVLTVLILHADIRNRCWPSIDLIAHEMSLSPSRVSKAKKWLLEHKAIELVPYEQRSGNEKAIGPRQHVYQLTGTIEIDGKKIPYLYFSEPSIAEEVNPSNAGNFEVSNAGNTTIGNTNGSNLSISESKDNTSEERNTNTFAAKKPPRPEPVLNDDDFYIIVPERQMVVRVPILPSHVPAGCTALEGRVIKSEERFQSFKLVLAVPPKEKSSGEKEKVEDAEPAAPKTQPHVAIIEAWHYSIPDDVQPIGKPVIERNCKVAKEIAEAGITPWDVVRFVTCTYGTYRAWAVKNKMPKVMKLEHVKEYIRAYLAKEPTSNGHGVPSKERTEAAPAVGMGAGVLANDPAKAEAERRLLEIRNRQYTNVRNMSGDAVGDKKRTG